MRKIFPLLITALWLLLIIFLALIWWEKAHFTIAASIPIPYLILMLSFIVFNRTPTAFRRTHHWFTLSILLVSLSGSYYFAFHGGEQGGVGAYLLSYSAIATYLIFISLFLFALTFRYFWFKSK